MPLKNKNVFKFFWTRKNALVFRHFWKRWEKLVRCIYNNIANMQGSEVIRVIAQLYWKLVSSIAIRRARLQQITHLAVQVVWKWSSVLSSFFFIVVDRTRSAHFLQWNMGKWWCQIPRGSKGMFLCWTILIAELFQCCFRCSNFGMTCVIWWIRLLSRFLEFFKWNMFYNYSCCKYSFLRQFVTLA